MGLDFILSTIRIALVLGVVILIVTVWNRATTSTRFFGVGLCCEFAIKMFQYQLASIFLISAEGEWWHLLECVPLVFFVIALYTEFGWRVVKRPDNKRNRNNLNDGYEAAGYGVHRHQPKREEPKD